LDTKSNIFSRSEDTVNKMLSYRKNHPNELIYYWFWEYYSIKELLEKYDTSAKSETELKSYVSYYYRARKNYA